MNKHAGPRGGRERGKPKITTFQLANIDILKKKNITRQEKEEEAKEKEEKISTDEREKSGKQRKF